MPWFYSNVTFDAGDFVLLFFFLQARFTTLKVTCLPVDVHPQSMLCIDFKSQLLIIICKIFLNEELILKMYNYIVTKCKKQNYLK